VFQSRNQLRNGRLRHSKTRGRLGKAPSLHNDEKDIQLAEAQTPTDVAIPIDNLRHKYLL
jgi:hypothetical protein